MNRQNKYLQKQKWERKWKRRHLVFAAINKYISTMITIERARQKLRRPIPRYPDGGRHSGGLAIVGEGTKLEWISMSNGKRAEVPEPNIAHLGMDFAKPDSGITAIAQMYGFPDGLAKPISSCSIKEMRESMYLEESGPVSYDQWGVLYSRTKKPD